MVAPEHYPASSSKAVQQLIPWVSISTSPQRLLPLLPEEGLFVAVGGGAAASRVNSFKKVLVSKVVST